MTRPSAVALLAAATMISGALAAPAVTPAQPHDALRDAQKPKKTKRAKRAGGRIHNGTYTCYQGGLTSGGSTYWGTLKITGGRRWAIPGSKGTLRRKGRRVIFTSGTMKRWGWKGRYRTSRTPAGERQWHVDIIDRPNAIRIACSD